MRTAFAEIMCRSALILFIGMVIGFSLPANAVEKIALQVALTDLNDAVESYQMGNRTEALQALLSIATDAQYPQTIQQEARIYIGEILYLEGNIDGAREYFMETLVTDAEYNIDRFRHPPEICAEFDLVNAQFRQRTPQAPPIIESNRKWTRFAPFGMYQMQRGQTWKGLIYGGTQLTTGVSSIVLFNYLTQNPGYNANDTANQQHLENMLRLQRGSAIAFYSVWILSSIDAQRDWQIDGDSTLTP